MSKLVWDATGERSYETGVNHGVLYVQNPNGTYGNGVVWNGLTGVTESPDGAEANDLWADNIKYATLRSTETFGATIEAYMYPEEFAECDGSVVYSPGVYIGQQSRKPFGFCFCSQVGNDTASEDDDGFKLHIIYNATASPSERSYETINDSPDAMTFSWEITTTPVALEGYKALSEIIIDSTKCDKTKLQVLLDKLYGTENSEPTLPDAQWVLSTMGGSTTTD